MATIMKPLFFSQNRKSFSQTVAVIVLLFFFKQGNRFPRCDERGTYEKENFSFTCLIV